MTVRGHGTVILRVVKRPQPVDSKDCKGPQHGDFKDRGGHNTVSLRTVKGCTLRVMILCNRAVDSHRKE